MIFLSDMILHDQDARLMFIGCCRSCAMKSYGQNGEKRVQCIKRCRIGKKRDKDSSRILIEL